MNTQFTKRITTELAEIEAAGLSKKERIITSEQGAEIVVNGKTVLNFCANNYLGLSSHPKVIEAAHKAIDSHGYGMSSVRFICGTQDIHKELETKIALFSNMIENLLRALKEGTNEDTFKLRKAVDVIGHYHLLQLMENMELRENLRRIENE